MKTNCTCGNCHCDNCMCNVGCYESHNEECTCFDDMDGLDNDGCSCECSKCNPPEDPYLTIEKLNKQIQNMTSDIYTLINMQGTDIDRAQIAMRYGMQFNLERMMWQGGM